MHYSEITIDSQHYVDPSTTEGVFAHLLFFGLIEEGRIDHTSSIPASQP